MKKFLAILLVVLLCTLMASCGSDNAQSSTPSKGGNSSTASTASTTSGGNDDMTSSKPEVDTRYRATRTPKPDGFKYKEAKILIMGDSITAGDGTPSGYRYSLFEQLYASGAKFQFVGPKQTTSDSRLSEKYSYHCSTGGWKIQNLIDMSSSISKYDFDIVVVFIGRNDESNLSGIDTRYKQLLDEIFKVNPNASVYCSDVIPKRGGNISGDLIDSALNYKLPKICKEYTESGKKTTFVKMNNVSWPSDMYGDAVHPNEKGNEQIAKIFWDAILDEVLMINDSGDSSYVEPIHVSGVSISATSLTLEEGITKTITATVTPDNAEVKNVLWSSSNEKVATVNAYGKVTAVSAGEATITAKSLDKNITATCKLTVKKSSEPKSTNVFSNKFNVKTDWTGNTDFITDSGFATGWSTCSSNPSITSANAINAGNNFKLTFNYRVSGNVDSNSNTLGGYSKIVYAGYEIRIYNCVRTIELLVNGSSAGKYKTIAPSQDKNSYTLKVLNGKAILLMNGEEIISTNAATGNNRNLTASINDSPRCCNFSSITISKY